jgi:hypothetical protein
MERTGARRARGRRAAARGILGILGALGAAAAAPAGAEEPPPKRPAAAGPGEPDDGAARARGHADADADAALRAAAGPELEELRRLAELGAERARSVDVRLLAEGLGHDLRTLADELRSEAERRGLEPHAAKARDTESARDASEAGLRGLGARAFNVPYLTLLDAKIEALSARIEIAELDASEAELRARLETHRRRLEARSASTRALLGLFEGPTPLVPSRW